MSSRSIVIVLLVAVGTLACSTILGFSALCRFAALHQTPAYAEVVSTCLGLWLALTLLLSPPLVIAAGISTWNKRFEAMFKIAVPLVALGYFLYQIAAGTFFATTSVSLEAVPSSAGSTDSTVRIKLDRGDNWLATISQVRYALSRDADTVVDYDKATDVMFAAETDGDSRGQRGFALGPKETTATMLSLKRPRADTYLSVRVISYATWWPVPGRSYARILLRTDDSTSHAGTPKTPSDTGV